jgi:hypothetical protein
MHDSQKCQRFPSQRNLGFWTAAARDLKRLPPAVAQGSHSDVLVSFLYF